MLEHIVKFLTAASPLELFIIFIFKITEVAISTLRIIFINKGHRTQGTVLSFIEVLLWVFIVTKVIIGILEAPIKAIVYSIAFSIGVYLGSVIESHIGMGQVLIQTIISKEKSSSLVRALRQKGYAVTTMDAQGRDSEKTVLMIFANRKGSEEIINEIHNLESSAMIITNDVSTLKGGTIGVAPKLLK
ncbi:MAG: DUF5698 domain-containing protein [Spirochaetaceae bacterium]|nr:DUF5698 domain-containing protein [Spirochaetaceae bacterium]